MRRALVALSLTTVAFATTTAYLAYELWRVRTREIAVASAVMQPMTPSAAPASSAPAPEAPSNAPVPAPATERMPQAVSFAHSTDTDPVKQASEFLTARDNPESWRQLIEREKSLRRMMDPALARQLGLDAAEYDRLLEALVLQDLAMREKMARCALDPTCRSPGFDHDYSASLALETSAMIGPELYRRYEAFQDTRSERSTLIEMRGRLTDKDYLADAQGEKFILAMADERKRIERESVSRSLNFGSFGNGNITIYASSDPATAGVADELNRRLRDRAAQVLTPAQLLVYQQMQEEAMDGYRSMPRVEETAALASP